jgi:hypothetical protein
MRLDFSCDSVAMIETIFTAAELPMAVVSRISFQFVKGNFSILLLHCLQGRFIGRLYVTKAYKK